MDFAQVEEEKKSKRKTFFCLNLNISARSYSTGPIPSRIIIVTSFMYIFRPLLSSLWCEISERDSSGRPESPCFARLRHSAIADPHPFLRLHTHTLFVPLRSAIPVAAPQSHSRRRPPPTHPTRTPAMSLFTQQSNALDALIADWNANLAADADEQIELLHDLQQQESE